MEKWKQAGQGGGNFRGKGWRELAHVLGLPPQGSLDRTRWSDLNPLAQKVMTGSLNVMNFRVPYRKMLLG